MINEASPNNFSGSVSPEQLRSRVWISDCLRHIDRDINSCIVLGSWYGILPYVLKKYNKIPRIIANDIDKHCIEVSKKLNPTIKHIHGDCNQLHYKKPIDCVINPSVNNIVDRGWFECIPKGTLCLLQTENIETEKGCPSNLSELQSKYPLNKVLLKDTLKCGDNEQFKRSLIIGTK
jgi:hypothetical protein